MSFMRAVTVNCQRLFVNISIWDWTASAPAHVMFSVSIFVESIIMVMDTIADMTVVAIDKIHKAATHVFTKYRNVGGSGPW